MDELEIKKKAAEYWFEKHKNKFVHITSKNAENTTGILQDITPSFDLYIEGNSGVAIGINPLDILRIYCRPNNPNKKWGEQHE